MNITVIKRPLSGEKILGERNALLVIGLLIMTAAAYWPSTQAMWTVWMDPDFGAGHSHGLLVGLLSFWTLFRKREVLAQAPARPALWAYPMLFIGSLASLLFSRAGIQSAHVLLLPALAFISVLCVLGTGVARAVAFSLGYLYFSMPAWGLLAPMLQQLTTRAVAVLCPLIGIPANVAGNTVNLPGVGSFQITMACSGINFLVVGLAVAALIGELTGASVRRRMWLLASMTAGAIASNWLRALLIIGVGYATDLRFTLATRDHLFFGWIIFAAVLLAYVWWATAPPAISKKPSPAVATGTPARPAPANHEWAAFIAAAIVLCAAPLWAYVSSPRLSMLATPLLSAPAGRQHWKGPLLTHDPAWHPFFVGAHAQQFVAYQQGDRGRTVEVLSVGYARQEQGQELVNENNSLVGDRGLSAVDGSLPSSGAQHFRELTVVDGNGRHSLIWSIYDIDDRTFVTPLYSQLWYALRSFSAAPYSALFAFRAACEPSCEQARATLQSFLHAMGPQFLSLKFQYSN